MSSFFLGVDPSATGTGVSIADASGTCVKVLAIKPKKLRDADRLAYIYKAINEFIDGLKIEACVIETPAYGAVHKEFILGEVLGVIKLAMQLKSIPVIGATPTQLKKFLTGSGSAAKETMIQEAQVAGCTSLEENICDSWSAALLCLGIRHKLPDSLVTRPRLEVVKTIQSMEV